MTELNIFDITLVLASISLILTILFLILMFAKTQKNSRKNDSPTPIIETVEKKIKKYQILLVVTSLLCLLISIYMLYTIYLQNTLSVSDYIFTILIIYFHLVGRMPFY
jgi:Ca2+/Na+ antiporter